MRSLNDKDIRKPLIDKITSLAVKPKAIIEELRVHNGNAIADVVALYKDAHCFEIKGDGDKVERIIEQGRYYDLSFRKVTLVTTKKHLIKAEKIAPVYWGIMLAEEIENKISIKYHRSAQINPNFEKDIALLTLWKNEMLDLLASKSGHKSKSRDVLAQLISGAKRKEELSNNICTTLLNRYSSSLA
jgi:hypothetical protein